MTVLAPDQAAPQPRPRRRSRLVLWIVLASILLLVAGGAWWVVSGWRDTGTKPFRLDFDGAAGTAPDESMWTVQTGGGGWGNNELQEYTSDAVALDGEGSLAITATIPRDGSTPTSGRLTSQGNWSFTYGTLSARIKLPEGPGILPAFWLLGDDIVTAGWPGAGEVDIVETPTLTTTSAHHVHGPSGLLDKWSVNSSAEFDTPLSEDFHTYTVERSPGRIVMLIDDRVVLEASEDDMPDGGEWVFDNRFHMLFSLAVGGDWPGAPTADTAEEVQMLVDWIEFTPAAQPED